MAWAGSLFIAPVLYLIVSWSALINNLKIGRSLNLLSYFVPFLVPLLVGFVGAFLVESLLGIIIYTQPRVGVESKPI